MVGDKEKGTILGILSCMVGDKKKENSQVCWVIRRRKQSQLCDKKKDTLSGKVGY